jgi:hypothetical protein
VTPVALGGAACGDGRELLHGLSLGGQLEARFLAGFGFGVESLGDGGGAAHLAEGEDLDVEFAAFIADVEHVSDADFAGGLGLDFVGVDAAEVARFGGEGAGLEEARGPEPFVDADGHTRVLGLRSRVSGRGSGVLGVGYGNSYTVVEDPGVPSTLQI